MSRTKMILYVSVTALAIVIVLILTFDPRFSSATPTPNRGPELSPLTSCYPQAPFLNMSNGIGVTNVKTSLSDDTEEYIGLSEGKFAFDRSGPNGTLKCQASQALNQGKIKDAEKLWGQALQLESNDAEVLIYQENQRILNEKRPYINIIVGVVTSGTVISNGLDVLQGTYVAQKSYNQDHQNSIQLRVIIANFGSTSINTSLVAGQIITATRKDAKIKAMVDLPALANTSEVLKILSHGDFPIVLSSGSTSKQENGGNFFHVAATTTEQGQQGAKYVEQKCPNLSDEQRRLDCQESNVAVFIDAEDNYSSTLGSAFLNQILSDKAANKTDKNVTLIPYDSTNNDSIVEKVKAFGDTPPDLIYFAGDAVHANILLQSLLHTPQYTNLRILGGDALYQVGSYRASDYPRLNFTAFAYPDEWDIFKSQSVAAPDAAPEFFCDYARDFAGGVVSTPQCDNWQTTGEGRYGYRYSRPENEVMLSYDALDVILAGNQAGIGGDLLLRDQLLQNIRGIDENHPFKGVSGRIAFGPDGNPIDKAILVLRVNENGDAREQKSYGVF